ncbi:unnamed protein product [Protopolystoma xenopodis]|uniref:Uncharacterized protein n=1 Tax=Protopolystoma xenopodis TaxID=117903 RepID=A0A3S5BNL8_9PLAT|nr:unnamed protein product [Protopolystoma xenopodis]
MQAGLTESLFSFPRGERVMAILTFLFRRLVLSTRQNMSLVRTTVSSALLISAAGRTGQANQPSRGCLQSVLFARRRICPRLEQGSYKTAVEPGLLQKTTALATSQWQTCSSVLSSPRLERTNRAAILMSWPNQDIIIQCYRQYDF